MQPTPGLRHARTAVADKLPIRVLPLKGANQIGAMQVAAGFANRKEQLHDADLNIPPSQEDEPSDLSPGGAKSCSQGREPLVSASENDEPLRGDIIPAPR